MLIHLAIRDYAIVDELALEPQKGLTAITGETGAGKSIMLDALGLVLGDRASSDCVRTNAKNVQISAEFDISNIIDAQNWLQIHDLNNDECILRRVISSDGRSRAYINGTPCPVADLQSLGELLIDIHAQHEHQSLLKTDNHRKLLDNFAHANELTSQVQTLATKWQEANLQLINLTNSQKMAEQRIEFIRFTLDELEQLNLQQDELEQLEQEFKKLSSAHELISICQQVNELAEHQFQPALININRNLTKAQNMAESLNEAVSLFETAQIQADEALKIVANFLDDFAADPACLQQIETRLALIYQIARKHGVQPYELLDVQHQFKQELTSLEQSFLNLDELTAQLSKLESKYRYVALKLSQKRQQAAQKLNDKVSKSMQELGMQNGSFMVHLSPNESTNLNPHGLEKIEFLVITNPGQPPKPLIKVASGGELSRISLAINVITAQTSHVPTLIFDEVDVGIGGPTAEVVGQMLRKLGENGQVITVTHLAQVASYAHQHWRVGKSFVGNITHIDVDELDAETRIHELARMLGGLKITPESLAHAKTLLKN